MDSEAWLLGTEASRPGKECVLSTYCALSSVPGSHVNVLPSSCQWPHQPAAWWENRGGVAWWPQTPTLSSPSRAATP